MSSSEEEFRVLVADDSPVSRKLLQHALEDEECTVFFARNGQEALELFHQHRPQLVITDWMMPDVSGPELCRKIRAERGNQGVYLLLFTSHSSEEQIAEGLAAGADGYLVKPFDREALRGKVQAARAALAGARGST